MAAPQPLPPVQPAPSWLSPTTLRAMRAAAAKALACRQDGAAAARDAAWALHPAWPASWITEAAAIALAGGVDDPWSD